MHSARPFYCINAHQQSHKKTTDTKDPHVHTDQHSTHTHRHYHTQYFVHERTGKHVTVWCGCRLSCKITTNRTISGSASVISDTTAGSVSPYLCQKKVMNFTFDEQYKDSRRIWCFKLDNCWFDITAFWTSHALHVRIFCVFVFNLSSMCLYPCIVCLSSSCQYNSTLLVKPAEVCLLGERPIVTCLCSRSSLLISTSCFTATLCTFFFSVFVALILSFVCDHLRFSLYLSRKMPSRSYLYLRLF